MGHPNGTFCKNSWIWLSGPSWSILICQEKWPFLVHMNASWEFLVNTETLGSELSRNLSKKAYAEWPILPYVFDRAQALLLGIIQAKIGN